MQVHALGKADEDDYGTFEYWLSREGLTAPPLWLADLRGPKPLEERLWFAPQDDINAWVEDISDKDFLTELGLVGDDGSIVVGGYHDTRSHHFKLSARVHTALVSPDSPTALVRALQTINDSWDYRIPPAGDSLEIDVLPYRLVGWLVGVEHDSGKPLPPTYVLRFLEGAPKDVLKPNAVLACYVLRPGKYRALTQSKGGNPSTPTTR